MKLEATAAAYCNSLFVTGIGKECDEIWRFDANYSDWKKCASLVQGRRRHSATFIECSLFICGGYLDSNESAIDSVEAYDTLNNRCVTAGTLAYAVQNSGNGVAFKASIYIFGGLGSDDEVVNTVQVYDTMLNTCSLLSKRLPVPKFNLRAAMWENSVILIGHNGCFKYDFDTDTLEVRNQFKTGVAHFGLTVHNGNIFVIGGGNWMAGAYGGIKWVNRNDVRFIPVAHFLKDESTEWKLYAKFPKPSLVFAYGKVEFLL